MLNKVIIQGRLTADPELSANDRYTICRFTVACQRDKEKTDFIPVKCWNKTAELVNKYFGKGSPIIVEGRIQVDKYEKDGQKRTYTEVNANTVHFEPKATRQANEEPIDVNKDFAEVEEYDGDLPF